MSLKKNRGVSSVLLLAALILFGGNGFGGTSNGPTDNDEATVSRQKDLLHFDNDGKGIGDVLPFYWNGEYHVFYQAPPPRGVDYVSWGHSVSTDLVNWEILPYAILSGTPEEPDGHGAYSGSVVENNGIFHAYYTRHNPANLERLQPPDRVKLRRLGWRVNVACKDTVCVVLLEFGRRERGPSRR